MKNLAVFFIFTMLFGCSFWDKSPQNTASVDRLMNDLSVIENKPGNEKSIEAVIGKKNYDLAVAETQKSQEKGLMFREYLPEKQGMIFVFNVPEKQAFWMKNTKIPLDILWLSEEKRVVHFVMALPCETDPCPVYVPEIPAKYVIELNAGQFKGNLGDFVEF